MRAWMIMLTAFALWAAFILSDWRNRASLFDGGFGSIGHIEDGAMFGAEVGSSPSEADEALGRHGYRRLGNYELGRCGDRDIGSDEVGIAYEEQRRRMLRGGSFCLVVKNGAVSAIGWNLGLSMP